MSYRLIRIIVVILLCPVESAGAQGGSAASSLSGVVVDPGGGVVPGASVVVKNNATGVTLDTVTNTAGAFSVPALDPVTYTVTVSLMRFKTAVVTDVKLVAAMPASIKVTLDVGSVSETIEVKGHTDLIQTQSATVSSTIGTDQIKNLPLETRNALNFVTFLPGVDTIAAQRNSTISGLPQNTINITLDGVNVNNNRQKSSDGFYSMVRPQLDAIEEVTLTGATPGAESAGQGAVQVRFVTRSGSDRYPSSPTSATTCRIGPLAPRRCDRPSRHTS